MAQAHRTQLSGQRWASLARETGGSLCLTGAEGLTGLHLVGIQPRLRT